MSDFVYDNTAIPEGKSDAAPLSVAPNKGITAAEWNLTMQAIKDLRTAILAGDYHGLVDAAAALSSAGNGRITLKDTRLQFSENGGAYKSIGHGSVNVLDFGADPTGIADSSAAFTAAINSFFANAGGSSFTSLAGTVLVPPGTYRLASTVSIKRSVLILGAQGGSYFTCRIKPDKGITAFCFESYNTPKYTTDNCSGGFAQLVNVNITPADICGPRVPLTHYDVGDRVRFGTGIKEDSFRHFECMTAGTTSADADGPYSWGNDMSLNYDDQTVNFTKGRQVQGATSLASGYVVSDSDAGTTGTLRVTSLVGTFQDDEIVRELDANGEVIMGGGSATVNGAVSDDNTTLLDGDARWKYIGLGAGVVMRTAAYVRDCGINATSGNGIHIEAQSREVAFATCNANGWGVMNISSFSTQGHNVFVKGSDANGGFLLGGYMLGGGGATSDNDFSGPGVNICDMSFLGNTYVSVQFGSGGQGPIISRSVGGGNTFLGCYVEGTGGGWIEASGTCTIIGGGLAVVTNHKPGSTATVIGPGTGRGMAQAISGRGGFPWIGNVNNPLHWRINNNNLVYDCITPGVSAPTGGPTGTGSDITDGTAHWAYVGPFVNPGQITFGSTDSEQPSAWSWQWPSDIGSGGAMDMRHGTHSKLGTQATRIGGFCYGDPTRTALMLSSNYSELTEWPCWIPAGNTAMFETWIGGCHIRFDTAAPTSGLWNKGDLVLYKGSAAGAAAGLGLRCTTPGTAGTYTGGRTLTSSGGLLLTVSGALMQTLRSGQDFHTGDYITVDSIPTHITSVADDGMSIGVADVIPAGTYAPTFTAPTFTELGSVDVTLTAVGSTPSANGASLSGQALTLQPADGSHPGLLAAADFTKLAANTADLTLAAVGSTPGANGASLSGQVLTLQPADASNPGLLTAGTQTIAGPKTLTSKLTLSGATSHIEMNGQDGDYLIKNTGVISGHEAGIWVNGGSVYAEVDSVVGLAVTALGIDAGTGANLRVRAGHLVVTDYLDDSATAGNRTNNHYRGRNKIALGATTCVITNNLVDADKQIDVVLQTNDATAVLKNVVFNGTGFTVTLTAAATADTIFGWHVIG